VGRAPWLGASGGRREAGRKIVELLESVADGDLPFVTRADLRAEIFLDVAADEEHHAVESGAHGIMHRIIEEGFPAGPDRIELLESAVAAAHSGSEDEESGCRHEAGFIPPLVADKISFGRDGRRGDRPHAREKVSGPLGQRALPWAKTHASGAAFSRWIS